MNRFIWALRHEIALHLRNLMVIAMAVAGSMMLFRMLPWIQSVQVFNVWSTFPAVTIITGVIITAGIFQELRSPGHRIELLLRPASVLEKVGAKLLVSTVLFWLLMTLAHLAVSVVAALLYRLAGGDAPLVGFFNEGYWLVMALETMPDFLPVQALFFFGAVYFRKNPAGRTMLSLVGWLSTYVVAGVVALRFIFAPYFPGDGRFGHRHIPGFEMGGDHGLQLDGQVWREIVPGIFQNPELLYNLLRISVVLVFWALAFLRFRETEG